MPFHQERLVDVMGGSETTPTDGGAAAGAAAARAFAAPIAATARWRLRRRAS